MTVCALSVSPLASRRETTDSLEVAFVSLAAHAAASSCCKSLLFYFDSTLGLRLFFSFFYLDSVFTIQYSHPFMNHHRVPVRESKYKIKISCPVVREDTLAATAWALASSPLHRARRQLQLGTRN